MCCLISFNAPFEQFEIVFIVMLYVREYFTHKGTLSLPVKGCNILNFAQRSTSAVEHGWVVYRAISAMT